MEQRTEEWYQARLGKVTASRIADVMAKTKSGYGASRKNYMAELIVERLTGQSPERFENAAMRFGTETEPLARSAYEVAADVMVEEVGFVDHPTIPNAGASPDGLVGTDGLVEIKCPNTATMIEYLTTQKIEERYILQMEFQLLCTRRKWCDFVMFDPRLPERLQLSFRRYEHNADIAHSITGEVMLFLEELDALEAKLRKL